MKSVLACFSAAVWMAAYGSAAVAAPITLKIVHFLPATSNVQQKVIEPWCEDVKQASGGQLVCQIYPSMQLGGTPANLSDQVRRGVADIAWMAPGYTPGRFIKTEVLELPGVLPQGGLAAGKVIWAFYQQHLVDEYDAYKVLALHSDGGMNLHTTKHPLRSSADLQGLRMRVPNRTISRTMEMLGAVPVAMPPAMVTEALSKGVVDGASAVWEVIGPTKMDELTHFHLDSPVDQPVMGATILGLLMNQRKYESLPVELRDVIDQHSGQVLVERFGQVWDAAANETRQAVMDAGHEVNRMSPEDYAQVLERVRPVEQSWIVENAKNNIDGQELIDAARRLTASQGRP